MAEWGSDSEKERRESLASLEGRGLSRRPRKTSYVGMNEAEKEMLVRLSADLGMSHSGVFKVALHGLYFAHFGRQQSRERG